MDFFQFHKKTWLSIQIYHHPTHEMPKLTFCLPPVRRRPKAPDSECNGNIASFRRISSNLIKTQLFTYLIFTWHLQCQNQPFVSHLLAEDSGPSIPSVVAILPNFDDFLIICQNSTNYTDLSVIQPVQWWFWPFVSHLFAEDPRLSISSVVSILPDFDEFFPTSSKLDHLYRFSRHPTIPMVFLTFCFPPVHWGPRALDSQCRGNIARFRWIS